MTSACARRRGAAPSCGCWPTRLQRQRAVHMQHLATSWPGLPEARRTGPTDKQPNLTHGYRGQTHATTRPRIATLVALRCCGPAAAAAAALRSLGVRGRRRLRVGSQGLIKSNKTSVNATVRVACLQMQAVCRALSLHEHKKCVKDAALAR